MHLHESMQVISETTCYLLEMRRLMSEGVDAPAKPRKAKGSGFGRLSHKVVGDVARELHKRLGHAETEHHRILQKAETHRYHSPEIEHLRHNLGAIKGYRDMLALAPVAIHHPKAKTAAFQGVKHAAKMLAGEHKHLYDPKEPEDLAKKGDRAGWKGRSV